MRASISMHCSTDLRFGILICMARVAGFIDGFNVYHAIDDQIKSNGKLQFRRYKWIDYRTLCEQYLEASDHLGRVVWFTAYVKWKSAAAEAMKARHRVLARAMEERGVEVELGKFRPVTKKCLATCRQLFNTFEEKRTDVKIALWIYRLAALGEYDKAIIVSGDSDLLPALEMAHAEVPEISFVNVVPIGRTSQELSRPSFVVQRRMNEIDLKNSRLPDVLQLRSGRALHCPQEWV